MTHMEPISTVYSNLGLHHNPFLPDGAFVPLPSQRTALDHLRAWFDSDQPLAIVTGEPGVGKTRVLHQFANVVARNNAVIVPDSGARRTDLDLLRSWVRALGTEPHGRTGLELRQEFLNAASGHLLLADGAELTGSQLEILQSLLTEARARFVLFAKPVLATRIARRPALLPTHITLRTLSESETATLVHTRLQDAGKSVRSHVQVTPDALQLVHQLSGGNPALVLGTMHTALVEALARGTGELTAELLQSLSAPATEAEDQVLQVSHRAAESAEAG